MTRTKRTTAAAVIVAGLLVSGCSSNSGGKDRGAPAPSASKTDPAAAVIEAARSYQEAANKPDWHAACIVSSARLRGGSVEECTAANAPSAPSASPSPEVSSSPSPTTEPPRYADGSTPQPRASRTTGGPDRADTGPVIASAADLVEVPAAGVHPAGWGVLVTYSVTWPGKPSTTARKALRVIAEGQDWRVDQHEDVQPGDEGHGSPVRAALGG
ncbi:hypothetical protein [Streptomyces sp. NPDC051546]|uniref:hypothetical protein n=1 Tax=Streptomyces sp. NPDC051546 TaxID=3365655 RepID=UPI00378B35FD